LQKSNPEEEFPVREIANALCISRKEGGGGGRVWSGRNCAVDRWTIWGDLLKK
jgi:hypothetical protein